MRIKVKQEDGLGQKIVNLQRDFGNAQKNLAGRKKGRHGQSKAVENFDRLNLELTRAEQVLMKRKDN